MSQLEAGAPTAGPLVDPEGDILSCYAHGGVVRFYCDDGCPVCPPEPGTAPDGPALRVIRCVRCWLPLTDTDDLIRVPFAATSQPSVAHRTCPEPDGP